MAIQTTLTIRFATHDASGGIGGDDGNDDDEDRWRVAITAPAPHRDVAGAVAPAKQDLKALGVFNAEDEIVFKRGPILVRLERFGILPDGRVLLTVKDASLLPTDPPRPGNEGA